MANTSQVNNAISNIRRPKQADLVLIEFKRIKESSVHRRSSGILVDKLIESDQLCGPYGAVLICALALYHHNRVFHLERRSIAFEANMLAAGPDG